MFDDQKMNQIKVTIFTIYIPGYKSFSYVTKTENMKPTNILHKCPRINKHFEPVLVCCGFFLTVR